MDFEEKVTGTKHIFDGNIIKLRVDDVLMPDGSKATREVIAHNGGVGVIALTDENEVPMVSQYRIAAKSMMLEIPAGKLEKGEMPQASALRELEEEAGYKALSSEHLITIYPTVGYCSEKIYVYLVTDYEITETNLDENEFVEVVEVTIEEAVRMIQSGEIKDGKTICAIYQYLMRK